MKKSLFFLVMALISVQSFAQIQRTAEFNFAQPQKLTPAVTPPASNSGDVAVTDSVFKNNSINLSFTLGDQGLGTAIQNVTSIYTGETNYYLKISSLATMTVSAPEDARIDVVRFTTGKGGAVGDLSVKNEKLGTQSEGNKVWTNSKSLDIHELLYYNNFATSRLATVTVTYTVPSVVLDATSNIANKSTIESFGKLNLTFENDMNIKDGSKIALTDGMDTYNLTATVKNNVVTLASTEKIVKEGTYTLTVPAKSFADKDGFENKEIKLTFTIKVPFTYETTTPSQGRLLSLPLNITADFGKLVGYVNQEANISLQKNGEDYLAVKVIKSSTSENAVEFKIQNINHAITEKATYTLVVPANTICNGMYGNSDKERWNDAFELEFIVDDSETIRNAKALLKNEGVGYPTMTSAAYVALKDLLDGEATDEQATEAMNAYYNETAVTLPATGKWYHIASVNAEGKKLYLSCDDEHELTLTDDADKATAFEATNTENVIKLQNGYDDFLNVNGLTADAASKEIELTLKKLDGTGLKLEEGSTYDASKTLGFMSISGSYKTAVGTEVNANAMANHETNEFKTDAAVTEVYLQNKLTNAFVLTEVDKPAEAIKTVETEYTLTPAIVESNEDVLTLTFEDLINVTVAENAEAYIAKKNGERVKNVVFAVVEGTTNQFAISLENLAKADYLLVIPEGTFLYVKDGKEVKTQAIEENFTVGKNGSADDSNLNFTYTNYQVLPSADFLKDTDLNNILIKSVGYYRGLVANPEKEVTLAIYESNRKIRSGHLENYIDPDDPETPTLKFVFDTPITEGELATGLYALVLPQGAFGDSNFGKFLQDKTSVNAANCHANPRMTPAFEVNNDKATGIDEVTTGSDKPSIIYDLMGRRVQNMSRPGIYIVNGKKVVKK